MAIDFCGHPGPGVEIGIPRKMVNAMHGTQIRKLQRFKEI
jgi:hypothetical protein